MPIENADYYIYILRLPDGVPGAIRLNSDGTYSMYLNPDNGYEKNLDTYEHELMHIIKGDLYGDRDVREIERI